MKTKAAFTSLLGLAVATSIFAGSTAHAQMRTNVAPKKTTAKSSLKTNIATVKPAEEKKSPFGLNISETYYGKLKNEDNYLENWITASVDLMENVSLSVESGFDTYMEKQEQNTAYDLEANLSVSGIEIAKDFKFKTGLIGVLPTSRASRDVNMAGGFGARANFSLKIGGVSLGVDNNFYQFAYKKSPIATPDESVDDFEDSEERYYKNEYTRATTVLSAGIPLGPLSWKNDLRIRQTTPYAGEEKRPMRFRTRIGYGITDGLTVLGGVSWQKNMIDQKAPAFFADKHRVFWLQLSLDV